MKNETIGSPKRVAVLSMDVEDWYHLDYFQRDKCNISFSLLDGLERYQEILADENVPSSFFVLGELGKLAAQRLGAQPDIGAHSWDHRRPLTLAPVEFRREVTRTKAILEEQLGREVQGYRAPCFSLDRQRLEILHETGYAYDSSCIRFSQHPLYGAIDLSGFDAVRPGVFRKQGFFEFEVSTAALLGRTLPIAGGGYLRLLPWSLMRRLLTRYAQNESFFVLYIHPFELSSRPDPPLPIETKWLTRLRFSKGRGSMETRLRQLIALLRRHGFTFSTFSEVRRSILANGQPKIGPQ